MRIIVHLCLLSSKAPSCYVSKLPWVQNIIRPPLFLESQFIEAFVLSKPDSGSSTELLALLLEPPLVHLGWAVPQLYFNV